MRISEQALEQIIKEEVQKALLELAPLPGAVKSPAAEKKKAGPGLKDEVPTTKDQPGGGRPVPKWYLDSWKAAGSPPHGSNKWRMWFNTQRSIDRAAVGSPEQNHPMATVDYKSLRKAAGGAGAKAGEAAGGEAAGGDVDQIADMLYKSMAGAGTNEKLLFQAVKMLQNDPAKAKAVEKRFDQKYGKKWDTLRGGIKGDLAGKARVAALAPFLAADKGAAVAGKAPAKGQQAVKKAAPTGMELFGRGARCPKCTYVKEGGKYYITAPSGKKVRASRRQTRQLVRALRRRK